jgi:hypothetical protein
MLAPARPGVMEPFCAKVCDFGLAKVWQQSDDEQESKGKLTATNMALGTPHYMAPEQASGERDLDQRADLYSLGASVFHALLGKTMHSGKSSTVIMYKQVTEAVDLAPLRQLGIAPGLIKLLGKMVERNRKHRFADWGELQAAIKVLAPDMVARQEAAYQQAQLAYPVREALPPASASQAAKAPQEKVIVSSSNFAQARPIIAPTPHRWWRYALMVSLLILIAAPVALLVIARPQGHLVTPATFAAVLAASQGKAHTDLVLEPGEYPGPWCFGAAHSGITIRAAGTGVRVMLRGNQPDAAVIQLEPGLRDFRLAGVELVGSPALSIEALPGSQAILQDITIPALLVVSGADLQCSDITASGGIRIEGHGHLLMEDSHMHGSRSCVLHDGHCELHRCRISGLGGANADDPLVQVVSGSMELDAVLISGEQRPQGGLPAVGLDLAPGTTCVLRDVEIDQVEVGLHSDAATVSTIDGLTINATRIGLQWSGLRDPNAIWTRILVHAPQAVRGDLKVPAGTEGARSERVAQVPASGDKHH